MTSQPDQFLLNKLQYLMVTDSKAATKGDGSDGTGPYKLKAGTKLAGDQIQLVASDDYHGGHVSTRALGIKVEPDEASGIADYKAGKVNLLGEFSNSALTGLKGASYDELKLTDVAVNFLTVNSVSAGPLQKKEVRQALRDSIDNAALVKEGSVPAVPASQLVTQQVTGYNPAVGVQKQDIAEAKSLLTKAGYPNGLTIELTTTATNEAIAKIIATQAQAAGITLKLNIKADFDQLIGDVVDGKTQVALLSYSSDTLDAADVFTNAVQQTSNYKSGALDDYLDQAAKATDDAKRLQILQKTSKYLTDEVAAIPLYSRYRLWVMDQKYVFPDGSLGASPSIAVWQGYTTK
jgi:peptide/nickel transport system substrate-binding protein